MELNIAIYGCGGNGKTFYNAAIEQGLNVDFFIDEFSSEESYQGIKIYTIANAPSHDTKIIVSVSCFSHQIAEQLKEMGFKDCIDFNGAIKLLPNLLLEFFSNQWLEKQRRATKSATEQLLSLKEMLADDASLKVLEKINAFRLSPSADTYLENDWKLQYFPDDVPLLSELQKPVVMIDCGAFTGDTLETSIGFFERNSIPIDSFYLFEPCSNNFSKLTNTAQKYSDRTYSINLYKSGTWSKTDKLRFFAGDSQGRIISESIQASNTDEIDVIALDELEYEVRPNFIKMDIEGAEIEALLGAKVLIKEGSPILAISVYHATNHLWKIPFLINQMNSSYQYFLRSHGDLGNEIILYAIPRKAVQ